MISLLSLESKPKQRLRFHFPTINEHTRNQRTIFIHSVYNTRILFGNDAPLAISHFLLKISQIIPSAINGKTLFSPDQLELFACDVSTNICYTANKERRDHMIITTTNSVEGKEVTAYKGIVFGEVITGINVLKDLGAGLRNVFGGRSKSYENELLTAREEALAEMQERAQSLGADAVIGIKMDYEVLGSDNGMLMVTCSGTAVKLI